MSFSAVVIWSFTSLCLLVKPGSVRVFNRVVCNEIKLPLKKTDMLLMEVEQSLTKCSGDWWKWSWQADPQMCTKACMGLLIWKILSTSQNIQVPVYQWALDTSFSIISSVCLRVCCRLSHLGVTFHRCTFSCVFPLSITLLWTCWERVTACHFLRQAFFLPSSHSLSSFLPPLPSSLLLKATRYAEKTLLMVFSFFFSCKLRYSVISDLAFSGFRRRSHCSPWSLTAMFGYDKSHRTQEKIDIFLSSSQTPKLQTCFSSRATSLCYSLRWFFSLSLPTTPTLYFQ